MNKIDRLQDLLAALDTSDLPGHWAKHIAKEQARELQDLVQECITALEERV